MLVYWKFFFKNLYILFLKPGSCPEIIPNSLPIFFFILVIHPSTDRLIFFITFVTGTQICVLKDLSHKMNRKRMVTEWCCGEDGR